ncbi:sulfite oxidase-like oxidoreductase [Thermocladium modestius]|uniref:Sulfite oxidase-like oxidoreductase n=1 Tax=Thermocladium modestius TaxID=62609 RepID=A0A830GZP7_9CREN|nr:molybdopterin-dependent oxidoreductase [Thermocladium modestius]GGP22428.1 sulfite oxidase-like oxidoreductase [Thermocladium modestius]
MEQQAIEEALTRKCGEVVYSREWPPNQVRANKFVIYDAFDPGRPPSVDEVKLEVTGAVDRRLEVTLIDMMTKLPCVDLVMDFHCVTGWSVSNVKWRGVQTKYLLGLAGPRGRFAMAVGLDGYTTNMPLDALTSEESIVAYAMNGAILPRKHGYPLRLVVPSRYAWKSAKYLSKLVVMNEDEQGYWEMLGYHDNGDPWLEERFRARDALMMRRRVSF